MGATDTKFRIIFEGVEQDAIAKIENVVKGLNTATQATKQFSRERQQLARAERQDRFRSLSEEEKYQRLLQRRETIERRLTRARLGGNDSRAQALELLLARNRSALSRQRSFSAPPPVISGIATPPSGTGGTGLLGRIGSAVMGQMEGRASTGMLGSLLGAAGVGTGIGATLGVFMAVGSALSALKDAVVSAIKSTIVYADQVSDTADQLGISNEEVMRLQQASAMSGVRQGKAEQAIANVAGLRSAALGGDPRSSALFDRYGISGSQLESGDSDLKIATDIMKSLGSKGISSTDFGPLKSIFGKRPDQVFALLSVYAELAQAATNDVETTTKKLGRLGDFLEQANHAFMRFKLKLVGGLTKWYEENEDMIKAVTTGAIQGLSAAVLSASKTIPFVGEKIHAFLSGIIQSGAEAVHEAFGSVPKPNGDRTADPNPFIPPSETSLPDVGVQRSPFAAADALARIGLFRGPIDPDRADVFRQQLAELRKIRVSQENTSRDLQQNLT